MKKNNQFHSLLKRQIKKHLPKENEHNNIVSFIEAVNETYTSSDDDRKLLEHSLEISSEELLQKNSKIRTILEAFPDIFLHINSSGKILDYKSASANISKLFPDQMVGRNIKDISFLKINSDTIKQFSDTHELMTFENSVPTQDKTIYFEVRIKALLHDQAIVIIRDITERVIAEQRITFAALHDTLTLLPNRLLLNDRLSSFIKRHKRNPKYNFAVLFIDFDRFKIVNDSLGHQSGDELLISISQRLLKSVRDVDTVARFGGDEFCVILDEVKDENGIKIVLNRLHQAFVSPFFIGNKEIFLTMSIGVVLSSETKRSPDDYIRDADIAMYTAKNNGRAQYMLFNQEMHMRAIKILDLEGDLHRAIKNNDFELHYQPIISLENNSILRLEALVRWIHHEKGMISPADFIPQAEQTGLILKIGEFVLFRGCADCKKWQGQGFPDLGVAINFSALQFHHTDLPSIIKKALETTKLDPRFLEIEITESVAMKNIDFTINILHQLKEMNVKVSIDDFGTGYSSLGSLIEFPIDSLKIDRRFIQDVSVNKQSNSLTTAIIGLAHNLGLKVVGEGIENHAQLHFLSNNKCDEGQGYLFSKPLPVDKIIPVLKTLKIPV